MELQLTSTVELPGGVAMPRLGLGVYQIPPGKATREAVEAALAAGYRHIDTAALYGNEADVGEAVRASGLPRPEVFVTTKLWNSDHGYERALAAFERSRRTLGLDVIDLYLVHWPVPRRRLETWRALEKLLGDGACRAIGVSNYMPHHLDELFAAAAAPPSVDQVELSPYLAHRELRAACRARGVVVQAYSPLTRGARLGDPRLEAVARKHGKSPAQILVRWGLEQGLVVLPKSRRPERIRENGAVFDFALDPADHRVLDGLDEGLHTSWDPTDAP